MLITLLIITLIGYLTINVSLNKKDLAYFNKIKYGQKVDVNGHLMNICIFGEKNNQTIVISPGLMSFSPYYEFKPLAEALSDKYKVVIIEPFGYGISDNVDDERTVDKISTEIHTAIKQLGIKKYYFLAHSFSGLYALKIAIEYPDEILGIIGIDTSVPHQTDEFMDDFEIRISEILVLLNKGANTVGITKLINKIKPGMLLVIDEKYEYTPEEIEEINFLALKKSPTKIQYKEASNARKNIDAVRDLKFPNTIPIFNLIAQASIKTSKNWGDWKELHNRIITETDNSEITVINGNHYLHLVRKDVVVSNIKRWLEKVENKN
ncbi:hypothetical protein PIROE2DRAFT_12956 [Piromyces sp. E2]|nr:hypothetical protein PIROE2DRAFT_12956 [Piromyces sp. E2]|eukprot:OUM61120.1 hypothetical protein PIROE2DRAFT_12956 [Piromyces sp. E2]